MLRVNQSQKIISVDSSSRTNGTSSNFNVPVAIPHSNAFNKLSTVICEMPKSYYILDSTTNNSFLFYTTIITLNIY